MVHSDSNSIATVTASIPPRFQKKPTKSRVNRRKKTVSSASSSPSTSPLKRARSSKKCNKSSEITIEDLTYYPARESCFDPDTFDKDVLGIDCSSVENLCQSSKEIDSVASHRMDSLNDDDSEHSDASDHRNQSDDMVLFRMMTDLWLPLFHHPCIIIFFLT